MLGSPQATRGRIIAVAQVISVDMQGYEMKEARGGSACLHEEQMKCWAVSQQ